MMSSNLITRAARARRVISIDRMQILFDPDQGLQRTANRASTRLRASWCTISLTTALITMVGAFDAHAVPLTPFRYEAQAQRYCLADTVVWLDFRKRTYYTKDSSATHAVWTEVLSAEARLATAVTGALCSAFGSCAD